MLAGEARAAARDWVARHSAPEPWFRGAYLAGSAADRPADEDAAATLIVSYDR